MTLFTISSLSVAIFCAILTLTVLRFASTRTHYIWALFNSTIVLWGIGTVFAGTARAPEQAIIPWRIAYIGATFIAVVYYHLVYTFCELKKDRAVFFVYSWGFIFTALISFSNFYIGSCTLIFQSIYYHTATPLFSLWLLSFCIIVICSFTKLWKFIRDNSGLKKIQALYLFWGMALGFSGGTSTTIPAYGINFYPAWQFTICIYMLMMTYAIFKHRIMDIFIVVKKGIIYSILIAIISIFYSLIIVLSERFLQGIIGYQSILFTIFAAFIFGAGFAPIKNQVQDLIDRSFFQGTHTEIIQQNETLREELVRSEKLKSIATLASGLAHEVKNPLTAIKTFTEFLPQKLDDKEFLQKFSSLVGKEVERINDLVHQLLEFAKPSPLALKPVNIHGLIDNTLDFLNSKFLKHQIKVEKILIPDQTLLLEIDANQLRQALLNLFLNAIEAMATGGTLIVRTGRRGDTSPSFEIVIQDTGPGIDPKDLPHIFDPFFSKKDGGTGLGLSITHGIIAEHKGRIKAESAPGKGTAFTIELPIGKAGPQSTVNGPQTV